MEPGLRDREYRPTVRIRKIEPIAAMEPGLRDREYRHATREAAARCDQLQWSPVLETGNTEDLRFLMGCAL